MTRDIGTYLTPLLILAALVVVAMVGRRRRRPYGRRPNGHSLIYYVYVDRRSALWRFRRWLWYYTSNRRCEECGCRLALHHHGVQYALGSSVLSVHHKNYTHLLFERRGRDVELLCEDCHLARDAWRHVR